MVLLISKDLDGLQLLIFENLLAFHILLRKFLYPLTLSSESLTSLPGAAGGGEYYYVQVWEFKSLEDMNSPGWVKVNEKAWPNEKKREEFFEKAGKYFAPGHTDLGTHWNWVKMSKR